MRWWYIYSLKRNGIVEVVCASSSAEAFRLVRERTGFLRGQLMGYRL